MGRVYNALVRAERVADPNRPIGRPERNGGPGGRGQGIGPASSRTSSAPTAALPAVEDYFDVADAPVTTKYRASSAVMPSTEINAKVTVPGPVPRPGVSLPRLPVSKSTAPNAPIIAFEEPDQVVNIRDLEIDRHVAALTGDDLLATERYRSLAIKLLNLTDQRKIKTVLITSAQAGDGKTTVAAGAAWSLAKGAQRRVLLIDASPASSSVARMLGLEPKIGWLNLLDGYAELKQSLIRVEPNGLYVLPAGARSDANSSAAWSSRFEGLIAELASQFDLVIVDSGTIVESSEAQRLASVLGGTVIVARANRTAHGRLTAARKLVPKERRLGVVLNESAGNEKIAHLTSRGNGVIGRLFGRRK